MIKEIGIIKKTSKKNRHRYTGFSSRQGAKTQRKDKTKVEYRLRRCYPADPSAALGMTGGRDSKYRRCDNCFFSIWMMSSNRPMLGCKQRTGSVGRYRIVQLEQSCTNFYPSGTFKAGSKAARRIPLTRGKFALVDSADYYRLVKFNWYADPGGKTIYAARTGGGKAVKMHRLIMDAPDDLVVDHIDHNGLNNCKSNLRLCTAVQNSRNMLPNNSSTSKYKGVWWNKRRKKWSAKIKYNYKTYRLGHFEDETEAAKAYDKRAVELHGEFACPNFPPETNRPPSSQPQKIVIPTVAAGSAG